MIKGLDFVLNSTSFFLQFCFICAKLELLIHPWKNNPLGKQSHGNSSYPPPPHSPSLGRAGRGGSKDAVGPCRSPLTVVYLCNKWNIHRGAAVTDRLHKSRGTQRAFQTSLCTWLTSVTRTTKLGLGPVDIQITSTIVQLFLEHHW